MLSLSTSSKSVDSKKTTSMGKTYYIRKVRGGGVSSGPLKKKKRVLVSFPHSATPLRELRKWSGGRNSLVVYRRCDRGEVALAAGALSVTYCGGRYLGSTWVGNVLSEDQAM